MRQQILTKKITKDLLGLEIGPLHNPICPKREGWNILTLDICDGEELRRRYKSDPNVECNQIEDVDIIYKKSLRESILHYSSLPQSRLANSDEGLDYIISSHNFEHQPNPLGFLRDCESSLKEGGHLVMAIPVASRCFDCFLPLTTSGKAIDAYINDCSKPSPGSIFDNTAYHATLKNGEQINDLNYSLEKVNLTNAVGENFLSFLISPCREYVDAHVSRFNHYSFELLIRDSQSMGILTNLLIDEIQLLGSEFIATIQKNTSGSSKRQHVAPGERLNLAKKSIIFHQQDIIKSKQNSLHSEPFDNANNAHSAESPYDILNILALDTSELNELTDEQLLRLNILNPKRRETIVNSIRNIATKIEKAGVLKNRDHELLETICDELTPSSFLKKCCLDNRLNKLKGDIFIVLEKARTAEKLSISDAYSLMKIALSLRPHGKFIKEKVTQYEKIILSSNLY